MLGASRRSYRGGEGTVLSFLQGVLVALHVWQKPCRRGPSWREKAMASVVQLPKEIAKALGEDLPSSSGALDR